MQRANFKEGEFSQGRADLQAYQRGTLYITRNRDLMAFDGKRVYKLNDFYNPNRGRIRRWLKNAAIALMVAAGAYAFIMLTAVACVVAGGSPQVCGL